MSAEVEHFGLILNDSFVFDSWVPLWLCLGLRHLNRCFECNEELSTHCNKKALAQTLDFLQKHSVKATSGTVHSFLVAFTHAHNTFCSQTHLQGKFSIFKY